MTRTTRTSAPNGPRKRETSGKRGAGAGAEALDGGSAPGTDWMAGGDAARAMDAPGVANGVAPESEGAAMGARLVTGESSGDASELTDGLETPRLPSTLGQTTSRLSVPVQGVSNGPAASQPAAPAPADGARTRDGAGPMAGRRAGVFATRHAMGAMPAGQPSAPRPAGVSGSGHTRPRVRTNPDLVAERAANLTADVLALTRQETLALMPELAAAARPVASTERAAEAEVAPRGVLIRGARSAPATRPARQLVPRRLRPHSPIAQAAVVVVTLATLLGILTVTSPLGRSAAIGSALQSYANAVAWVPTPTPTPKPRPPAPGPQTYPSSPGTQAVINEIKQVFGPYSAGALGVASCESGFDPHAWNPISIGGSHAEGVFQILYPSTWDGTSYAADNPYDANANIHAAYQIFSRDGHTWREWQCQP